MIFIPITAYVGPGAGLSALGALWALIASIFTALVVILFWPIRYLIRKMRGGRKDTSTQENP